MSEKKIFATWRTLPSSSLTSVREVISVVQAAGMKLNGIDILVKFVLGRHAGLDVEFVRLKVRDLGFSNPTPLSDIFEAACGQGLKLCHPEDSIPIRLGYREQPLGEFLWLAMMPVPFIAGIPFTLVISCDKDGLWLGSQVRQLTSTWTPEEEFIFCR